jgi:hypothetical protein
VSSATGRFDERLHAATRLAPEVPAPERRNGITSPPRAGTPVNLPS